MRCLLCAHTAPPAVSTFRSVAAGPIWSRSFCGASYPQRQVVPEVTKCFQHPTLLNSVDRGVFCTREAPQVAKAETRLPPQSSSFRGGVSHRAPLPLPNAREPTRRTITHTFFFGMASVIVLIQ